MGERVPINLEGNNNNNKNKNKNKNKNITKQKRMFQATTVWALRGCHQRGMEGWSPPSTWEWCAKGLQTRYLSKFSWVDSWNGIGKSVCYRCVSANSDDHHHLIWNTWTFIWCRLYFLRCIMWIGFVCRILVGVQWELFSRAVWSSKNIEVKS